MTLAVTAMFPDGIVMLADSRVTYIKSNNEKIRMDLGQKIFKLSDHIAVTFSGDIEIISHILDSLTRAIILKPEYNNIECLVLNAKRILEFVYKRTCHNLKREPIKTDLIMAGVSIARKGDSSETQDFEYPPLPYVIHYNFSNKGPYSCKENMLNYGDIISIGSGAKLIPEYTIAELVKNNPENEIVTGLISPDMLGMIRLKGLFLEIHIGSLVNNTELYDVGGLLHTATIDSERGVIQRALYTVNGDQIQFYKGWNGEKWSLVSKQDGQVYKLLSTEEVVQISENELKEIIL